MQAQVSKKGALGRARAARQAALAAAMMMDTEAFVGRLEEYAEEAEIVAEQAADGDDEEVEGMLENADRARAAAADIMQEGLARAVYEEQLEAFATKLEAEAAQGLASPRGGRRASIAAQGLSALNQQACIRQRSVNWSLILKSCPTSIRVLGIPLRPVVVQPVVAVRSFTSPPPLHRDAMRRNLTQVHLEWQVSWSEPPFDEPHALVDRKVLTVEVLWRMSSQLQVAVC